MGITTLPLAAILASNEHEDFPQRRALLDVSTAVAKSKRAVVISGAGISCSSGIPDFRSADGLYSLVKAKYPDAFFTGKDLFSSGLFNAPETTALFYTFIGELALSCSHAQPTRTHHFIQRLQHKGKLLRSYTQNIDGLERRLGIESGGRGTGFKKMTTKNVEMHGDLGRVRCVLCMADFEAREEWMQMFREGCAPWCPACEARNESRIKRSAREVSVGSLRPSIVLYDEPHPHGEAIGDLQAYDLKRSPDLLLVMGTSLKVHGLKLVVREFAKAVHAKKGLVVFVNLTPPTKEWEDVIDIHIAGETDAWVDKVEADWKHIRPADWEIQTKLEGDVVKDSKGGKVKGENKPMVKSEGKLVVKGESKPSVKSEGKQKAKGRAAKPEPLQLHTPRPSVSPGRRLKDSSSFTFSDDDATPKMDEPPSSPLTPPPSSPGESVGPVDSYFTASNLLSPSKRRAQVPPSPVSASDRSPSKKRTAQIPRSASGLAVMPDYPNLLFHSQAITHPPAKRDDDWTDEICATPDEPVDVFGSPVKARGRVRKPTQNAIDNKENTKPRQVRAVKATTAAKRRTVTTGTKAAVKV